MGKMKTKKSGYDQELIYVLKKKKAWRSDKTKEKGSNTFVIKNKEFLMLIANKKGKAI